MQRIPSRTRARLRRLSANAHLIGILALSFPLIIPPHLLAQNLDLGITDDASYTEAIDAIAKSEYVRYDYVNNPTPRIPACVAALMEFATRNPLADQAQLTDFVNAYAAALAAAAPGDPQLRRGTNLMPALRFTVLNTTAQPIPTLDGFDTNVGRAAAALLTLSLPDPIDFASLDTRTVEFDNVRERRLANAAEFTNILVLGLRGRDLLANDNPALAIVLQTFLESEGFEPVPDGVDDERFTNTVMPGLAALPADHADYLTAITQPGAVNGAPQIFDAILTEFDTIATETDTLLAELAIADTTGPTLLEGIAIYNADPTILDQLAADLQSRLDQVATCRTIIAADALLMHQNSDPGIQALADQTAKAALTTIEGFSGTAALGAGLTILGGAGAVTGGIAGIAALPATAGISAVAGVLAVVAGVGAIIGGVAQLVDAFGANAPSDAEQAILDELLEVRMDIETMRAQMNQRFDRIEVQLNILYQALADGFNTIATLIGDLNVDVENLVRDVMLVRSALERIEDALYGMTQLLLTTELAADANAFLNFRQVFGIDLPYTGDPAFTGDDEAAENSFYTYAVTFAKDPAVAGPGTPLTVANAHELLMCCKPPPNDTEPLDSIARRINELRVFPANTTDNLGLPILHATPVVAPGPWAQGAAAYAQLARENPWYFAFLSSGAGAQRIQDVIDEGQALADMAVAGRSQALFDALFNGYNAAVADLQTAIAIDVLAPLGLSDGVTTLDVLGPLAQDVQDMAPCPNPPNGCVPALGPITVQPNGAGPLDPGVASTTYWGLFLDDEPETASLLHDLAGNGPGVITAGANSPTATSIQLQFAYAAPSAEYGPFRVLTLAHGPDVTDAASFVTNTWNDAGSFFRDDLLTSVNLTGNQYTTTASAFPFDVVSDSAGDAEWLQQTELTAFDGNGNDEFGRSVSISGNTVIVGASKDDLISGTNQGSAHVFLRDDKGTPADPTDDTWSLQQQLFPFFESGDQFGWSVSIDGDDVIAGAPFDDAFAGIDDGSAYVFTRDDNDMPPWSQQQKIFAGAAEPSDWFGFSVAIDADTVIVGMPTDTNAQGTDQGSAYVFTRSGTAWTTQQRIFPDTGSGDLFGDSVAIDGDSVIVGARLDNTPIDNEGSAYVFTRDDNNMPPWTRQEKLLGKQVDDEFGTSVAMDGDTVIVGVPLHDSEIGNGGAAFVFTRSGAIWTEQARLAAFDREAQDRFGESVSIDGDTVIVGAWNDDAAQGSAYVFTRSGTVWTQQRKLTASDGAADDAFGWSVSLHSDTAIVGSLRGDGNVNDTGSAYVFTNTPGVSSLGPFIIQEFDTLRPIVLQAILDELQTSSSNIEVAAAALSDWESLIDAYATLSLPFAMEYSTILRSGLGGNSATSELALSGSAIEPLVQAMLLDLIPPRPIDETMLERSAHAQQEINDALAADPQGHPYLEYMLAELRHLRDHALDLATPDTYITPPDTTLNVTTPSGLLANDTLQLYRMITVDTLFQLDPGYVAPQHGNITLNTDGSFTYTPDPGFTGSDSFNYRTTCNVLDPPDYSRAVGDTFSNPATVVILVASTITPPLCPGDIDGDGDTDVLDFGIFALAFGSSLGDPSFDPAADLDANNTVNVLDFGIFVLDFGCPN